MSYPPVGPPPATYPQPPWGGPAQWGPIPMPPAQPRPAGAWQGILASSAVVLVVIAHFWEVSRLSHQSALIQDIEAGKPVSLAQARASDSGLNHSVVLQLAITLIAIVFVIVWAYHARANAERYTYGPFRRSKGWAIGAWICPVVSLWFPLQVVKDIWSASDTDRPDDFVVKAWPVNAIVPLWWTCLIASGVLQRMSGSAYNSGETASSVHTSLILDFASAAVHIAAAILFILVVAAITRFQAQRYDAFRAASIGVPPAA